MGRCRRAHRRWLRRCPWHHACFDLRTGEAVRATAFSPLDAGRSSSATDSSSCERGALGGRETTAASGGPNRIVIVGGGAAGFRRRGDAAKAEIRGRNRHAQQRRCAAGRRPRPVQGLSCRQRAGGMGPLCPPSFYRTTPSTCGSDLPLSASRRRDEIALADGKQDPLRSAPSCDRGRTGAPVHPRRKAVRCARAAFIDDSGPSRAAKTTRRAAVLGASFIGLEAWPLGARNSKSTLWRGTTSDGAHGFGRLRRVRSTLHEEHGVVFHLQTTATVIDGKRRPAVGRKRHRGRFRCCGPRRAPRVGLAESTGLGVDRGVVVDAYLETTARTFSPPATSRAGPTRTAATPSASNIGSSLSARDKPQR